MNCSEYQVNKLRLSEYYWINRPNAFSLENDRLTIITDPETDYWQRTCYGFQNDNAHTFINDIEGDFTFVVKTDFEAVNQYDQCGIILYQDSENWVKASVEYENEEFARLGSVVTNLGYSDWASTDISSGVNSMWYRFSRREQDFCIENSSDGENYQQMRIFHLHIPILIARIGVYACSPLKSSFKSVFSNFEFGLCKWLDHPGN
jgi:regulation of enolase protein 1 (concanavalin A-like superfamily)